MTISKFRIKEKWGGWKLNEVSFDDFNLLVGQSGVGKTKILNALQRVCQAGTTGVSGFRGLNWEIELSSGADCYTWCAETETGHRSYTNGQQTEVNAHFLNETIKRNNEILVQRDLSEFVFGQQHLPKLDRTKSALSLLQEEDIIQPVHELLAKIIFSQALDQNANRWKLRVEPEAVEQWRGQVASMDELQAIPGLPFVAKLYLLQEALPGEFANLKESYSEIFPTVTDLKADLISVLQPTEKDLLSLFIKEKGVPVWISDTQISSGMLRTLIHQLEVMTAASGAVIVIDELEDSLGVNCLNRVVDHLLFRPDLQFIVTSHHPYIINNIPMKYWKLVTRKGSVVTVKDASSMRGLDPDSLLSGFVQLTNLEEYEEAIR